MIKSWVQRDRREHHGVDWPWVAVILLLVGLARFPTWWVTHELNVDESQFVAGALALRHDPVFWRSLETTTSGPLNTYALLPTGSLLGEDTYLGARLTAAGLIALSLILVHQTMVRLFGRPVARVASLPPVLFEAFTHHDDFLHYSSELVPVALLATAVYVALGSNHETKGSTRYILACLLGGIVLGSVPLAKLQAAPIAALGGLAWLGREIVRRPDAGLRGFAPAGALALGAVLPIAGFAVMALTTGQWTHAVTSYLANNLWYVEAARKSVGDVLADMAHQTPSSAQLKPWLLGASALMAVAGFAHLRRSGSASTREASFNSGRARLVTLFALASAGVALFAIFSPRRPFPHYWQLFVIPCTLLVGCLLGYAPLQRRARLAAGLVASLATAGMTAVWLTSTHPYLGRIADMQARPLHGMSEEIARHQEPGDALSIWGWVPTHYVQTQLRPATRDVTTHWAIHDGPHHAYYQGRYLDDLKRARPRFFLDALPENSGRRHEMRFPELGQYIAVRYRLAVEIDGARLYVATEGSVSDRAQ